VARDRRVRRGRRAALLGAYAVATFLAFPHPVAGTVVDLGVVCAWLSPALLILGLEGLAPARAARAAFAASLVAHGAILHWLWVVTVVYGHAPAVAGLAGPLFLGAYAALSAALFGAGLAVLRRGGLAGPFALAALWTASEHLRSFLFTGFPWATLGYALHLDVALLPLASITGVYGLSFAGALGGAALADAARAWRDGRAPGVAAGVAVAALVLAHAAGLVALALDAPETGPRVRVAALQGNIDQGVKWSPAFAEQTLAVYEGLTREAAARGAQVVAWPETAVPGSLEADPALRARLVALARASRAALVVGAVGIERADGGSARFFDSAHVLEPGGARLTRYDKSHLVPFGEYVPFRDLLGRMLAAVARGIASGDVTPGAGPRAVRIDVPGASAPLTAGVPICYELIFPELVRRFVRDGAEILFAITNDAWYGRTGAPYQFLAMTAMRSAETRVWTVRAANTGVSAIIDARGRVRDRTRIFEPGMLVADVPLRPPPAGGSFYTRVGDAFAGACWLAAAGALLWAWRRGRGDRPDGEDGTA